MRIRVLALSATFAATPLATAQDPGNRAEIWNFVKDSYDRDGDGKVSLAEYGRGEERFARWDRDGDGVLTATDFERGGRRAAGAQRSGGQRGGGERGGGMLSILAVEFAKAADANHDGVVPPDEWNAWIDSLRFDDNGRLVVDSLPFAAGADRTLRMVAGSLGRMDRTRIDEVFADLDEDQDGTLQRDELGELPIIGDVAPTFALPLADDHQQAFDLASRRGKKPVALIFGSYT